MKIFIIKKDTLQLVLYCVLILISSVLIINSSVTDVISMPASKKIVMIDAGHGGADPGALSGKTQEKNINLQIAKKLQTYLEQGDSYVLMTRQEDKALASNKQSDMYKRKIIANGSGADIFVSIHQNANPRSSAKGAQVYYFGKSEKSKLLAQCIQKEIKKFANPSNKMTTMPNTDYFVLRQTTMPSVLVECGFMSNSGEKWRLTTEDYQERMAWAIYIGILKYFEAEQDGVSLE